ncbi:hypothetical protein FIBSPDRAFT_128715 [Athelia psychrophila]|uniref:Uncharacterized protein n=1 Tax=Athelia psychrophila TaxID=1759441 RepID=A0A166TAY3_9AGAM|nr:hypothetical protein FIBSPDRAFT_128715 [Fibularhizoctonia sp. CBS 109695]
MRPWSMSRMPPAPHPGHAPAPTPAAAISLCRWAAWQRSTWPTLPPPARRHPAVHHTLDTRLQPRTLPLPTAGRILWNQRFSHGRLSVVEGSWRGSAGRKLHKIFKCIRLYIDCVSSCNGRDLLQATRKGAARNTLRGLPRRHRTPQRRHLREVALLPRSQGRERVSRALRTHLYLALMSISMAVG